MCPNAVSDMEQLYSFVLQDDDVEEILPGAFRNVSNLRELSIINNKLSIVQDGVFNNLNVSTLDLSNNEITEIDSAAFDDMSLLRTINLQNNKLKLIDNNWFRNCKKLYNLVFEGNLITSIPMEAFKNVIGKHKYNIYELETSIILSNNKIKFIHPKAFNGIEGLGKLYLDQNQIKSLNEDTFKGLKYFKMLDLNNNQLKCLPEDTTNILSADVTYLEDNPWDCECLKIIKRYSIKNKKNVQIQYATMNCQLQNIKSTLNDLKIKYERSAEIKKS